MGESCLFWNSRLTAVEAYTSTNMAAGREFVTQFIEMYKELPCLWKTTDPDYHNKSKRNSAMDQLLAFFKEKDPDVTRDYVKKKITSLRGSFRKELNKVSHSFVFTIFFHKRTNSMQYNISLFILSIQSRLVPGFSDQFYVIKRIK